MLEEINGVANVVEEVTEIIPTKTSRCKKYGIIGGLITLAVATAGGITALVVRHKKKKKTYGSKKACVNQCEEEVEEVTEEVDEEATEEEAETKSKKKTTKSKK